MELQQLSKFSYDNDSQKAKFVSLLVQLLHSHTFEQEANLDKFIFNYRQKAGFRKQLSQALRTFLKRSFKSNFLEIYDTLEALRSFVEKLYEQRSDTDLYYPCDEMAIVDSYSLYIFSSTNHKASVMLGEPLVLVDVLAAVQRFGNNRRNGDKIVNIQRNAYSSLGWLISDRAIDDKSNISLTQFFLTSEQFLSSTKALLHRHVQIVDVPSSSQLLKAIAYLLLRFFSYEPAPPIRIREQSGMVEPMLRAAMGPSLADHYDIQANLLKPIRNCLFESVENKNQLCSVDGWADFLLSLLERLIEPETLMKRVKLFFSFRNNDEFILHVTALLAVLINRLSSEEKGQFVKLYSSPKICKVLVAALDSPFPQLSCSIVYKFMGNRLFVEQLKECRMVPALKKYRSSIKDQQNLPITPQIIDEILSIFAGTV